jgi:hypothetical protein
MGAARIKVEDLFADWKKEAFELGGGNLSSRSVAAAANALIRKYTKNSVNATAAAKLFALPRFLAAAEAASPAAFDDMFAALSVPLYEYTMDESDLKLVDAPSNNRRDSKSEVHIKGTPRRGLFPPKMMPENPVVEAEEALSAAAAARPSRGQAASLAVAISRVQSDAEKDEAAAEAADAAAAEEQTRKESVRVAAAALRRGNKPAAASALAAGVGGDDAGRDNAAMSGLLDAVGAMGGVPGGGGDDKSVRAFSPKPQASDAASRRTTRALQQAGV